MVTRKKIAFICYVIGVLLYFGCVEIYLATGQKSGVPSLIEWIEMPGFFLAVYCLVGRSSEHVILVSVLANIGFYLLVPLVLWKIFAFWKKQ
jgi:pheromone shutdown protein TraB